MLKRMLEILVCPFVKESSLELYELKTKKIDKNMEDGIKDSNQSNFKTKGINNFEDKKSDNASSVMNTNLTKENETDNNNKENILVKNDSNDDIVIEEGILFCNNCSR